MSYRKPDACSRILRVCNQVQRLCNRAHCFMNLANLFWIRAWSYKHDLIKIRGMFNKSLFYRRVDNRIPHPPMAKCCESFFLEPFGATHRYIGICVYTVYRWFCCLAVGGRSAILVPMCSSVTLFGGGTIPKSGLQSHKMIRVLVRFFTNKSTRVFTRIWIRALRRLNENVDARQYS